MKIFLDVTDKRNKIVLQELKKLGFDACEYSDMRIVEKGDLCIFSPKKRFNNEEIATFLNNIQIIGGNITEEQSSLFHSKKIKYINVLQDERFAIENAKLTAEGVLNVFYEQTQTSLWDKKFLVIGLGRIGKFLSNIFESLNIDFAIGSFSEKDSLNSLFYSSKILDNGKFLSRLNEFDVVINTIPKRYFSDFDTFLIKKDALFIETASIDCLDESQATHFKFVRASGLPQKYVVQSAANLLLNKILEVIYA